MLDDIDDTASTAYASLPDRLYLVGKDGEIAFAGDKGPRGFKPDLLPKAIEVELEKYDGTSSSEQNGETGQGG